MTMKILKHTEKLRDSLCTPVYLLLKFCSCCHSIFITCLYIYLSLCQSSVDICVPSWEIFFFLLLINKNCQFSIFRLTGSESLKVGPGVFILHPVDSDVTTLGTTVVVQLLSYVQLFVTPWTAACPASLSITIFWSLPKFVSIELVMTSNHHILATLFFFCLQSFPVSGSFLMSWPFTSGGQSIGTSSSASVLFLNNTYYPEIPMCRS